MKRWESAVFGVIASAVLAAGCSSAPTDTDYDHGSWYGKGPWRNKKQNGPWMYWYDPARTPRAKGSYRTDRQVGPWTYWHPNEAVAWEAHYQASASSGRGHEAFHLAGLSTFFWDDGSRRTQGFFSNGRKVGVWSFWGPSGRLSRTGGFDDDRRTLRWTYYHDNGKPLAEGYRIDGEKVGRWRYWESSGTEIQTSYPVPAGYELVRDEWDADTPRREGFLRNGEPEGLWTTSHSNGQVRASGIFRDGKAYGHFALWKPNGEPLAAGAMKKGKPFGNWRAWGAEGEVEISVRVKDFGGAWSNDRLADEERLGNVVGVWLGELMAPSTPTDFGQATKASSPRAELVKFTDREAIVPILPQPFTRDEVDRMDDIYEMYVDYELYKSKAVAKPGNLKYPPREVRRDDALSDGLENKPLPWTKLYDTEGDLIDLADKQGQRKVMIVVLRGFAGQVCVYCTYQVRALAGENFQEAFRLLNTDVVVVYPGSRSELYTFTEAYKAEMEGQEVPFTVAYDPDFALVKALGIEGDLAVPTTVIVDESGTVRYAYVGKDLIVDRPSAKELITALDKID